MGYNILVIEESNAALRERITSALTREGYTVATSAGLEGVLSRQNGMKPHLIILGEGLPVDNFEVCRQLRKTVDIPILIIGADAGAEVWAKVAEVGADFYLVKPFSYMELIARVKALLRRYEWNGN